MHFLDDSGSFEYQLEDCAETTRRGRKISTKEQKEDKSERVESAIYSIYDGINPVTIDDLIEYFSTDSRQVSEKNSPSMDQK